MPIKLTGINDLKRVLKEGDIKIRIAVNSEIHKIATDILNESKKLVPFDEGILRSSGHLKAGGGASKLVATQTVEFGGPSAPYALIQHENEKFWHPPKPPGKSKVGGHQGTGPGVPGEDPGAKYLEIPAKKHQATVVPRLIAAIKAVT